MKFLSNAAVFGLVPVPLAPPTAACNDDADRHIVDEDAQIRQRTDVQPGDSERMATEEELARLRRELGMKVAVDDARPAPPAFGRHALRS
jgi:hypothetical protein